MRGLFDSGFRGIDCFLEGRSWRRHGGSGGGSCCWCHDQPTILLTVAGTWCSEDFWAHCGKAAELIELPLLAPRKSVRVRRAPCPATSCSVLSVRERVWVSAREPSPVVGSYLEATLGTSASSWSADAVPPGLKRQEGCR